MDQGNVYDLARLKASHNHPAYAKMALLMGCGVQVRGEQCHVIEHDGRRVLALFDQYGNQSFGYGHPRIVEALKAKLDSGNVNSSKILFEEDHIRLAQRLAEATGGLLPYAYFANGGGETIDNALKLARAATGRQKIVSMRGCFHGKTFGALSAAQRPDHVALFEPLVPGFSVVPFNDLDALRAELDDRTAAVILEPIQAEAGVVVPAPGYLRAVAELCRERGALLIFDEMQTAFGRTGDLFAFQRYGVAPDIVCIGKAFGGGIVPISAVLGRAEVWGLLASNPTTFGSSLGGNPLSCRAGLEVIALASEPSFLAAVRASELILERELRTLPAELPTLVREVRGVGMMYGIELYDQSLAGLTLGLLFARGVTSTYSLYNTAVLRVQPPMIISEDALRSGLAIFKEVLREVAAYGAECKMPWKSQVECSFEVECSVQDATDLLHRHPHALDAFAADNWAQYEHGDAFVGSLGRAPLHWANQVELRARGVTSTAGDNWLWRRLIREVAVAPNERGGATIHCSYEWDAGTVAYEPFLAAWIAFYCRRRFSVLAADAQRKFVRTSVIATESAAF